MKTFKNLKSGILEHVTNEKLLKQYEKYIMVYKQVSEKSNKEPTLKQLKKQADSLGLTYDKKITRQELAEILVNTN